MRILYINPHPVWNYGLPWGFRQLGHVVRIVKVIQQDILLKYMEEFQPDLIVSVGFNIEYRKKKGAILKKLCKDFGCLHVYWATEDIIWYKRWSLPWVEASLPDAVFTINADCIPYYEELGIPAYHLDFGYNPGFELLDIEKSASQDKIDLALVAHSYEIWKHPESLRYKSMEILLTPLIDKNYQILLCGEGWERAPVTEEKQLNNVHYLGTVNLQDSFRVFKSAKIIINPQNYPTQLTSRTYEILGCGGFQLTVRTPAVERAFIHQRHLIMSGSPAETLELVDYYLGHEDDRQDIAKNGREEVLEKHTYVKRVAYMLSCLNLPMLQEIMAKDNSVREKEAQDVCTKS